MIALDLGCGPVKTPGAIGYDVRSLPGVDVVGDALRLPFRKGSVDRLYSHHVVEHFTRSDGLVFLKECKILLRDGGDLWIACPDMVAMCRSYLHYMQTGNYTETQKLTHNFVGGQDYAYNHHYWLYNKLSLAEALDAAGFSDVEELNIRDMHELYLCATA